MNTLLGNTDYTQVNHKNYFLNHSVGLPFKGVQEYFQKHYFDTWQHQVEPWPHWLENVDLFRCHLATLINAEINDICPQSNLSSGLTKLLYALPKPSPSKNKILLSEEDFPSMAFVLKKAECLGYKLSFIQHNSDLQNLELWEDHLKDDVALTLITHVQSNNGRQLPVAKITKLCRNKDVLSIIDVAQSIGLLVIDVQQWQADFVLGSCVKWLCGGSGAGFMWIKPERLAQCQPVDVGWFSHENPFEFDIHHFDYHNSALRFWGGTPAVMSHINAGYAISQINKLGVDNIRQANLAHMQTVWRQIDESFIRSPQHENECSGTLILHFNEHQTRIAKQLNKANIAFDQRETGLRLSPHFYNSPAEVEFLIVNLSL